MDAEMLALLTTEERAVVGLAHLAKASPCRPFAVELIAAFDKVATLRAEVARLKAKADAWDAVNAEWPSPTERATSWSAIPSPVTHLFRAFDRERERLNPKEPA